MSTHKEQVTSDLTQMVALSEPEAFRYAKSFFSAIHRKSLAIEKCEIIRDADASLEGVYSLTAYFFYSRRQKK